MKKIILAFVSILLYAPVYSQKVERWESNGDICEIIEDTATVKPNCCTSFTFCFLGDFNNDKIKVKVNKRVLVDTIVSSRNQPEGIEPGNSIYKSGVKIARCCPDSIDFIFQSKKATFPFKEGYSIVYFGFYPEKDSDGKNRTVFSARYTNEFLIRL